MSESPDIACRLCLEENCKDLFYNLLLEDGNNRSNKALIEIFRINIDDNVQLPQKICLECNNLLLNFYEFYLEVMKNQAKLMLGLNSHACESEQEHASPQPSNIVDDDPPQCSNNTASQDSQITTTNQSSSSSSSKNGRKRKRKRRGSTHRDRELTPLSTDSEEDELPLSVLVRRPSSVSQKNGTTTKFTCQECFEEFEKIYFYETHKETEHSSYPVDASPNIDTIKIIVHSGTENLLKFKCKLCTFQSESQWETRRHQSTMHTPEMLPNNRTNAPNHRGQKLVKVLSLNAIAERVPQIKKNKNLTENQRMKLFYGFSCSRCKPPIELNSLLEFEKHSEEMHNLTDISWLCCEVKLRNNFLREHLNYHLGIPQIDMECNNFLYKYSHLLVLESIKKKKLGPKSFINLEIASNAVGQLKKKRKGGWPKGKLRSKMD